MDSRDLFQAEGRHRGGGVMDRLTEKRIEKWESRTSVMVSFEKVGTLNYVVLNGEFPAIELSDLLSILRKLEKAEIKQRREK